MLETNNTVELTSEFSDCVLSLFKGAREKSLKEFKPWVFEHLQQIVRFDSGLWVSRSDVDNPIPEYWAEDTSLFNLPDSFMVNYQRLATLPNNIDPLYQLVINNPHEVMSLWDAYESRNEWQYTNYYLEHSKYFNIENMLSTYIPSGNYSSILHALSFYRKDASDDFNESERNYIKLLLPILVEAFRTNVLSSFKPDWKNNKAYRGTIDRWGELIEAESGFIKLLTETNLLNDNKIRLDINQLIDSKPLEVNALELKSDIHNGIIYIEVIRLDSSKVLSPKQLLVAKFIAVGLSDKQVAKKIHKSISAVRYHKKNIAKIYGVKLETTCLSYLLRQ